MPRQQEYVLCPSCGDPVPGPFPCSGEFIQCGHCQETFPFDAQAVETALIEYHELEGRWTVVPIHSEMDAQVARILDFCTQSAPGCIVHIMPVGPDSFRVRVKDRGNILIDLDLAFFTHELAAKSDDDLWKLLENVSNRRIRRGGLICEGTVFENSTIRVLVVDDYEPWRRFVSTTFQTQPELQVICEVADGLEAVQKAQQLQPDLILLDIGLPKLNGIEAARRIRELSPKSRILFLSENRSWDIAEEALRTGADGYVVKSDAGRELLPAIKAVLRRERFVGSRFAGRDLTDATDSQAPDGLRRSEFLATPAPPRRSESAFRHEAHFYSDDASLLDSFTQFIGAALNAGNAVIVVATDSHRDSLLPRLQAYGLDIGAATEEGRYIALDAAETVMTFMVNDLPDPARFLEAAGNLITMASKAAKGERPRVAVCGECEPPLWTLGKGEAAIRLEQLWNKIALRYDVDILCGYPLGRHFHSEQGSHMFQKICAEHSAVCFR
jgi:DNA-binding NarL/FixJ family response regulator